MKTMKRDEELLKATANTWITCVNYSSLEEELPLGGSAQGSGIRIHWEDEPLGLGKDKKVPTGALVEDVINVCMRRIEFYQRTKFACSENATAIKHLKSAISIQKNQTTKRRERSRIEGFQISMET